MKRAIIRKTVLVLFAVLAALVLSSCKSSEVKSVESLINNIGEVTVASFSAIDEANAAYESLSKKDKAAVSNYSVLKEANDSYNKLFADKVSSLIDEIGNVSFESGDKIKEARDAYEQLTNTQQAHVNNYGILLEAESKYSEALYEEAKKQLNSLSDTSLDDPEAIDNAKILFDKLLPDQRASLRKELGIEDETKLYEQARIKRVEGLINRIDYEKDVPSQDQLEKMIAATKAYQELDAIKYSVENKNKLEKALKGFSGFIKNREKVDKIYARDEYIKHCINDITYEDLFKYQKSNKGNNVSFEVIIDEKTSGVLADEMIAHLADSENVLFLVDSRKIKEPVLNIGDVLTVYGKYDGMKTITEKEAGSGWFGTGLFEKASDSYDIPKIDFAYTSVDNLGIIASGNPNTKVALRDENYEALVKQLEELSKDIKFKG